jgi:hypothetical protein
METNKSYAYNPMMAYFFSVVIGTAFIGATTYMNGPAAWTESRWPIIVGVLVAWLWPINVHAWQEAYRIEVLKRHIDHRIRMILRVFVFLAYGTFIHWFSERELTELTVNRIAGSVFLMGAWFWLLFDYLLNHHRDRPFTYIGKTSAIDRVFFKLGWFVMLLAKILAFAFAAFVYYKLLTHEG